MRRHIHASAPVETLTTSPANRISSSRKHQGDMLVVFLQLLLALFLKERDTVPVRESACREQGNAAASSAMKGRSSIGRRLPLVWAKEQHNGTIGARCHSGQPSSPSLGRGGPGQDSVRGRASDGNG